MAMLAANVVGTTGTGSRVLLVIHGYGADEEDLAPLAEHLDPDGQFFTVCPRGPIDVAPFGGAAWYHRSDDGVIDPASFQHSVLELDHLLDAVCAERGADRSGAVVIGFSQGGAMALALSLRETTKAQPAGVACLSGMLQTPEWFRYIWQAEGWSPSSPGPHPALYVQHGLYDPMVDIARGRATRDTLSAAGIALDYHEYPMGHEIRPESVLDLRAWLSRLAASGSARPN